MVFSAIFDRFFLRLAGNENRHKNSDKSEIQPNSFSIAELVAHEHSYRFCMGKMVSPHFFCSNLSGCFSYLQETMTGKKSKMS